MSEDKILDDPTVAFSGRGIALVDGEVTTASAIRFCAELCDDTLRAHFLAENETEFLRKNVTIAARSILDLVAEMPPAQGLSEHVHEDVDFYSPKYEVYEWMPHVAHGLLTGSVALMGVTEFDPAIADEQLEEVTLLRQSLRGMYIDAAGPEYTIALAALNNLNEYLDQDNLKHQEIWVALEARFNLLGFLNYKDDQVVTQSPEFAEALADLRWAHFERSGVADLYQKAHLKYEQIRTGTGTENGVVPEYDEEAHERVVAKRNAARLYKSSAGQNTDTDISPEGFGSPEFLERVSDTLVKMQLGPFEDEDLQILAERARATYIASARAHPDFFYGIKSFELIPSSGREVAR